MITLHFNRLPARYALDVNVERAEDVHMHKRLLQLAEDPARLIIVVNATYHLHSLIGGFFVLQVYPALNGNSYASVHLDPAMKEDAQSSYFSNKQGMHPPSTFGSSPNLEAFQACRYHVDDGDGAANSMPCLSQVEIQYLWTNPHTGNDKMPKKEVCNTPQEQCFPKQPFVSVVCKQNKTGVESLLDCVEIPSDGTNVWEMDTSQLKVENKVASGSYGDLYRGMCCSQEVAIKVLKPERVRGEMLREFYHEVYIMRKVRHKNVVQFIGACTRSPNLCIVTEFMAKGSLYKFLHKQKGVFKLPSLIKVVVKVVDFGFSRVQTQSGVMTAETGTYNWMAPAVHFTCM
ncbi:hypothetical protein POTOM_028279 [Populus tomentosa]|uniref:non-specific serine/threonine protein kinase n=1 Tax=Populus tomentosa TaxID=118781 RepID=A0A8X7ZE67_POPTO|nr:hypothetical protein POTOM_028279 [Populus tomentosa]